MLAEVKTAPPQDRAPKGIARAGRVVLALVLASAAYLIWVRGTAIMADLEGLAAWCF